jgi:acetylornithine deacetylase/succinyl-diaminopimelate desuccinylase-like protein
VVPGRADRHLDYRNIPGDEPDAVLARLQALDAQATSPSRGARRQRERAGGAVVSPHRAGLRGARRPSRRGGGAAGAAGALAEVGRAYGEGYWWFGTDAPHLAKTMPAGGVVIGFGPGEEELAHTTRESVPLAHLEGARRGYAALLRAFLGRDGAGA